MVIRIKFISKVKDPRKLLGLSKKLSQKSFVAFRSYIEIVLIKFAGGTGGGRLSSVACSRGYRFE